MEFIVKVQEQNKHQWERSRQSRKRGFGDVTKSIQGRIHYLLINSCNRVCGRIRIKPLQLFELHWK